MVKLSNGIEIIPNMNALSIREYRSLFAADATQENEDNILARVFGFSLEEFTDLGYADYRLIVKEFFEAARDPVASSPN